MSSRNDLESSLPMIGSFKCCHCQKFNRGVLVPEYPIPCQHCQHGRCYACIVLKNGGLDQISSYGPSDFTALPTVFAAAPAPRASQSLKAPTTAPRASTEPRDDDVGSTLKGQDMLSMSAGSPSLESTTSYTIHNTAPNRMMPPPISALQGGGPLVKNHAGHVPNIPMHPPVGSLHGGLSHTRIGDFSSKHRSPRGPMPLQMAERRYTTPGAESAQSPPSSSTSAYFSESVMSASPSQSDFGYLPSDYSTASLQRDESLNGAELPQIPPLPSLEPTRLTASGPRRPAILSEKSPKRPIHRKPKGPLPPRLVNPDDPKDFKTAQNTIAARGTRQRKMDSATWLLRYRDETKVYIRDLEAYAAAKNERVAILERENQELRDTLSRRPGSEHPARYAQYLSSSSSKHGSFEDLPTAHLNNAGPHQHREIVPMQMPNGFPIVPDYPSIEDYLKSIMHEQSIDDILTTEPGTARPYDHFETSALRQVEPYASAHDSPGLVASEFRTATDDSLFGDIPTEAGDRNTPADDPPATPNTAFNWDMTHVIGWSEAQELLGMDDYEVFDDSWTGDNHSSVAPGFGSPQTHQNVEEGQVSLQA